MIMENIPCIIWKKVDLLLRARLLTLKTKKVLNMDTDFLLDLDKLMCEEEGEKKYLFTGVCPCTVRVELPNLKLLDKPIDKQRYNIASYSTMISLK
jgi:hypothetical protein